MCCCNLSFYCFFNPKSLVGSDSRSFNGFGDFFCKIQYFLSILRFGFRKITQKKVRIDSERIRRIKFCLQYGRSPFFCWFFVSLFWKTRWFCMAFYFNNIFFNVFRLSYLFLPGRFNVYFFQKDS